MEDPKGQEIIAMIRLLDGESMDTIITDQEKQGQNSLVSNGALIPRGWRE